MPGIYEKDQVLKVAEVGDKIFIAESEKVPFSRLVKRGKQPNQMLAEWGVQAYPRRKFTGTIDGTDISSFNSTNRTKLSSYGMWLLTEGWLASKLANLTNTAGVGRKEKAKQAADDAIVMAQMIERQLLSDMDTAAEAAPTQPYQSRGVFSWLSTTAQGVLPVNASFRPSSDCVYTSALASFRPSSMETMLEAAASAKGSPVDLTGFVGIKLKTQMSKWAMRQDDVGSQTAIQSFNLNASEKKFMQIVDFFQFDAGVVKTLLSWYMLCTTTTGENSAYTTRSGAFLDLSMWEIAFLQAVQAYMEPPKSGGPRGYHDAVYILKCLNPLGQCMVKTNS